MVVSATKLQTAAGTTVSTSTRSPRQHHWQHRVSSLACVSMSLRVALPFAIAAGLLLVTPDMRAMPTPAERVADIQKALRDVKLDGWLFYDFRGNDPLALRILRLNEHAVGSRRWFYYVPASGECAKLVHRIEAAKLDPLPGKRTEYSSWKEQHAALREILTAANKKPRIAMQYSPMNDIPYMSKVDAGTVELIRSLGVEVVTSAELVQQFEAVWTPEQLQSHIEASDKMHRIFLDSFAEIARRIRADEPTTEYDIQQFVIQRWPEEGMGSDHDDPIVSVNANTANPTRPIATALCRLSEEISFCWILPRSCRNLALSVPIRPGPVMLANPCLRNSPEYSTLSGTRGMPPLISFEQMCGPGNRSAALMLMTFQGE